MSKTLPHFWAQKQRLTNEMHEGQHQKVHCTVGNWYTFPTSPSILIPLGPDAGLEPIWREREREGIFRKDIAVETPDTAGGGRTEGGGEGRRRHKLHLPRTQQNTQQQRQQHLQRHHWQQQHQAIRPGKWPHTQDVRNDAQAAESIFVASRCCCCNCGAHLGRGRCVSDLSCVATENCTL